MIVGVRTTCICFVCLMFFSVYCIDRKFCRKYWPLENRVQYDGLCSRVVFNSPLVIILVSCCESCHNPIQIPEPQRPQVHDVLLSFPGYSFRAMLYTVCRIDGRKTLSPSRLRRPSYYPHVTTRKLAIANLIRNVKWICTSTVSLVDMLSRLTEREECPGQSG